MKNFGEMSQSEINSMSTEEFNKVSPFEKKSCSDCAFLVEALHLWCGNKQAIKDRGTNIPGGIKCRYWKPDWNQIEKKHRTKENGYLTFFDKIKSIFKAKAN